MQHRLTQGQSAQHPPPQGLRSSAAPGTLTFEMTPTFKQHIYSVSRLTYQDILDLEAKCTLLIMTGHQASSCFFEDPTYVQFTCLKRVPLWMLPPSDCTDCAACCSGCRCCRSCDCIDNPCCCCCCCCCSLEAAAPLSEGMAAPGEAPDTAILGGECPLELAGVALQMAAKSQHTAPPSSENSGTARSLWTVGVREHH